MSSSLECAPARGTVRLLFTAVIVVIALVMLALPSAALAAGYVYVGSWGSPGAQNGQFVNPMFACTDPAGNVYVSDKGNDRIEKFRSDGTFLRAWGTTGTLDGQFNNPQGVCYDAANDLICVVDYDNHNIQEFTRSGVWVRTFGTADLVHPIAVCYDVGGHLVVTDSPSNHAVVFTTDGTNLGTLFDGHVIGPRGIVCDPVTGEYYVADAGNHMVQMFDSSGSYDGGFGSFTVMGQVALDPDGNVIVCDWGGTVSKWAPDGTYMRDLSDDRPGADSPPLSGSWGVATAADGSVYIANYSGDRIDRYVYDTTPPQISDDYDHEWHNADFAFTINATDDWAGVKGLFIYGDDWYTVPMEWLWGVDPVSHSNDGSRSYIYYAEDNVGNDTTDRVFTIKIDTRPPVTAVSGVPATWVNHDVTLGFSASDRGAGVAASVYSTDGGSHWTPVSDDGNLTISSEGDNAVEFHSWDAAVPSGNSETPKTVHVLIDTHAPTAVALNKIAVVRGMVATFKYSVTEALSPTVTAKIQIKKGSRVVRTISLGTFAGSGLAKTKKATITLPAYAKYTWVVAATDLAGNVGKSLPKALVVK